MRAELKAKKTKKTSKELNKKGGPAAPDQIKGFTVVTKDRLGVGLVAAAYGPVAKL